MNKKIRMAIMLLALAGGQAFASPPDLVNYQGRLMDSGGAPVNGSVAVVVRVYSQEAGGAVLWSQNIGSVAVTNGLYSFQFGDGDLPGALTNAACWVDLELDSESLMPRQRLVSIPYALRSSVAENALTADAAGDADTLEGYSVAALRNLFTPPGSIIAFGGSSAPSGWVLCNGSAYSRAGTYSNLFAAIGTTYGAGDGSTTFSVPNLKGRTIVMQDSSVAEFDALGESGGRMSTNMTHYHTVPFGFDGTFIYMKASASHTSSTDTRYLAAHSGTMTTGGVREAYSGQNTVDLSAVSLLQPYRVLNYIIKY